MLIDLMTPFWGGLTAGIVLAVLLGLFRFIMISVEKKAIEKKFFHLISELESLQKSHKNEIASIKESNFEIIKKITTRKDAELKNILDKYHRLVPPAKLAFLEQWDNKNKPS